MADRVRQESGDAGARRKAEQVVRVEHPHTAAPASLRGPHLPISHIASRAGNAAARRALRGASKPSPAAPALGAPIRREDDPQAAAPAAEAQQGPEAAEQAAADPAAAAQAATQDAMTDLASAQAEGAAAFDRYFTLQDRLVQAATPPMIPDVPAKMQAQYQQAHASYAAFAANAIVGKDQLGAKVAALKAEYDQAAASRAAVATTEQADAWIAHAAGVQQEYAEGVDALSDLYREITKAALEFAAVGRTIDSPELIQALLPIADEAAVAASQPGVAPMNVAAVVTRAQKRDQAAKGFTVGDAVIGVAGIIAESVGIGVATTAAVVAGTVFGSIGVAVGVIGAAFAIRAAMRSADAERSLEGAEQYLTGVTAKEVAKFGRNQKMKKKHRQIGVAVLGTVAAAVGLAGVLSGGLGLAIAGIVIGVASLGLIIAKHLAARQVKAADDSAASELAAAYVAAAARGEPEATKIVHQDHQGDPDKLKAWAASIIETRRRSSAEQVVAMASSDKPSDRFNGETLLQALHVKMDDFQAALDAGDQNAAVALVERKLQSW